MASFNEHISQAFRNLQFLEKINHMGDAWDWQITVAYYAAVHLANGHIARMGDLHFRKHKEVNEALNPLSITSIAKVDERSYIAYMKLSGLSRRARYLCHEGVNASNENAPGKEMKHAHLTYDRHFAKAIRQLNNFMDYFHKNYGVNFPIIHVKCLELSTNDESPWIKIKSPAVA